MTSTLFPSDHDVERHAPPEPAGRASPLLTHLVRVWRGPARLTDGGWPGGGWRPRAIRMARCMAVSVLTTGITLGILTVLIAAVGIHATAANVVATAAGTAVSFELNRRWVWRHRGPVGLRRQVLPFWVLSFAGLALSSLAVEVTARVTAGLALSSLWRALVADAANVGTFGSLWVVQFLLLDRWLFSPECNRAHLGAGVGGSRPSGNN